MKGLTFAISMKNTAKEHSLRILFWVGLAGIIFYTIAPVLFPDLPVRQPELLPVYSSMIGLSRLLKDKVGGNDDSES